MTGAGIRLLDDDGAGRRILRDMNGTAADDRTAAVQAQSFARAILTDITASLFQTVRLDGNRLAPSSSPVRR